MDAEMDSTAGLVVAMDEVATILGVSRQRATVLADRPDFPAPVAHLAVGRVWLTEDVQRFAAVPRRTGRPRKQPTWQFPAVCAVCDLTIVRVRIGDHEWEWEHADERIGHKATPKVTTDG
jgi:hypothetical protein